MLHIQIFRSYASADNFCKKFIQKFIFVFIEITLLFPMKRKDNSLVEIIILKIRDKFKAFLE